MALSDAAIAGNRSIRLTPAGLYGIGGRRLLVLLNRFFTARENNSDRDRYHREQSRRGRRTPCLVRMLFKNMNTELSLVSPARRQKVDLVSVIRFWFVSPHGHTQGSGFHVCCR
jgi:hypothetical protein